MFNFFDKLKNTVSKTAQALVGNVVDAVSDEEEFSDFVLDDMEDLLISADLGVGYAGELVDKLRGQNKIKPSQVKEFLENEFLEILNNTGSSEISYKDSELNIYFITGVNGAGKTTLIGKMAYRFKEQGTFYIPNSPPYFYQTYIRLTVIPSLLFYMNMRRFYYHVLYLISHMWNHLYCFTKVLPLALTVDNLLENFTRCDIMLSC